MAVNEPEWLVLAELRVSRVDNIAACLASQTAGPDELGWRRVARARASGAGEGTGCGLPDPTRGLDPSNAVCWPVLAKHVCM